MFARKSSYDEDVDVDDIGGGLVSGVVSPGASVVVLAEVLASRFISVVVVVDAVVGDVVVVDVVIVGFIVVVVVVVVATWE